MLSVQSLTRVYGETTVLDEVSFDVRPGRMTGFVGANGAGKTTTMRIMVGVLAPTAGQVLWDAQPITTRHRRSFGYMPEERGLFPKIPVLEQLVFFARLHGMESGQARQRALELLEAFGLVERRGDLLETLSLGNQQRVQIAAALIHHPTALILDEPFSGLDPIAVDAMTALLREQVSDDVPVLFSSHQIDLVERLCDDLVILSNGSLVASGSTEHLRGQGPQRYRVVLADGEDAAWLRDLDGVRVLDADGPVALLELGERTEPSALLASVTAKSPVVEFARVVRPLSQVYKEVIE